MNIPEAMWSSFYDDADKIVEIVRGAIAMDGSVVIIVECDAGASFVTHRVSLFTSEQYETYLRVGEDI